jgi:hypothetical protein
MSFDWVALLSKSLLCSCKIARRSMRGISAYTRKLAEKSMFSSKGNIPPFIELSDADIVHLRNGILLITYDVVGSMRSLLGDFKDFVDRP